MRSFRILGLALLTAVVGGCGGDSGGSSGPEAGVLRLTLDTPNTGDGAILFRVTGVVDSVQGGAMMQDGSYNKFPTFTRIVVAGNLTDGPVAYLFVPDVHDISTYAVTIEQVAVKATNAQRALTGYSFSVAVD